MYELLIKYEGEKEYLKFLVKDNQELQIILENIKKATEEIRFKRINEGKKL